MENNNDQSWPKFNKQKDTMEKRSEKPKERESKEGRQRMEEEGKFPKEDKIDSIFIAKQLVMGDEMNIGKWLFQFKQIKNQNYEKFTSRIGDNLKKANISFSGSCDRFIAISRTSTQDNTTYHQMLCILNGFYIYWKDCNILEHEMSKLFHFIDKVHPYLGKKFITCCRQLILKCCGEKLQDFARESLVLANKFIKANRVNENKVLPLIYEFDLYGDIPFGKIIDLILFSTNINDVVYVFMTHEGDVRHNLLKLFVDRCVGSDSKSDMAKCQSVVKILKENPFQFDNYITRLQERYICYLVRAFKLYNIELIIAHDRKLILLLIEELHRQRRGKEVDYFIVKYQFQEEFNCHYSKSEKTRLEKIRNILLEGDRFGPTEVEVLEEVDNEQMQYKYLYMSDFGFSEKDVVCIDSKNIGQLDYLQQFQGKIGMDEQRAGGTHVFDLPICSTLQIFNGRKVFIFDCQELGLNKVFRHIIAHIFTNCIIYGQDLLKELTTMQSELQIEIDQKIMQELMRNRVVDSSKYFKQVFPKETKSNLAYLCQFIFKKTLSKYEQCSGWARRPLRKAQLHYAALDSILPYKLCEQLSKLDKKK